MMFYLLRNCDMLRTVSCCATNGKLKLQIRLRASVSRVGCRPLRGFPDFIRRLYKPLPRLKQAYEDPLP